MNFGEYLVEQSELTNEQLEVAMEDEKQSHQLFGTVALRNRYLRVSEVAQVLYHQAKFLDESPEQKDGLKFGQIAVELGFLTLTQVEEILNIQRDFVRPLEFCIASLGVIPPQELARHLAEYRDLAQSPSETLV